MEIKAALEKLNINFDAIQDLRVKALVIALLNIIEDASATIQTQQEELQRLRDELNRLKGEQGQPAVKPASKSADHSSEAERKKPQTQKKHGKKTKNDQIKIDRTEVCRVDQEQLPPDAKFQGYQTVLVQDLKIETDNVAFKKEVYYSPAQNKTYVGQLPAGYEGGFGPTLKALVIVLKNIGNMTESKILEFVRQAGMNISTGTISNLLIKNKAPFHQEKADIVAAGLASTPHQQIDDTSARVKGENHHTHVLGNPFYTAYFTTPRKDRLTVLKILNGNQELAYSLNPEAFELMKQLRLAQKHIRKLEPFQSDQFRSKIELETLLAAHLPDLPEAAKGDLLEAAAIAAYHQRDDWPVVKALLADDAPQFNLLTEWLGLCWIHEGRHYKKLAPVTPYNVQQLQAFVTRFWDYYHKLPDYKNAPSKEAAAALSTEFDQLFATRTGYRQLDDRIAKSGQKKETLLLVLTYPQIPLHNNDMELAARAQARKRDVSFHTMSNEGTAANDTFLTITQTCKKLGVNATHFLKDRISKNFTMPSLAQLIRAKSSENACA